MKLLVDIGNTRVKWAWLHGDDLLDPGAMAHAAMQPGQLAERMTGGRVADEVRLSSVAGAQMTAALVSALSRLTPWPVAPQDSRLALFWALLAIAPAMLLAGLTAGLVGPGPALGVTRAVAGLGFLVIWGAGLRALAGNR